MTIQSTNGFNNGGISSIGNDFGNNSMPNQNSGLGAGGGGQFEQLAKLVVGLLTAASALQEMGQGGQGQGQGAGGPGQGAGGLGQGPGQGGGAGGLGQGPGQGEGAGGLGQGPGQGEGAGGLGQGGEGKGANGLGEEGNSLQDFLSDLMDPEGKGGEDKKGKGADSEDLQKKMEELLSALLEMLMGGAQGKGQCGQGCGAGQGGAGPEGAGGPGAGAGAGGPGAGGMGGLGDQLGLGNDQKGKSGLGDQLMQGLSETFMKGLMSPTKDGGGQLSGGSSDITSTLANFMDGNQKQFGSPSGSGDSEKQAVA